MTWCDMEKGFYCSIMSAPPVDGKAAWHGVYQGKKRVVVVSNKHGRRISYATPEAALTAAMEEARRE